MPNSANIQPQKKLVCDKYRSQGTRTEGKKKGALENKLERPAIQIIEAVQHKMDRHQSTLHGCIV